MRSEYDVHRLYSLWLFEDECLIENEYRIVEVWIEQDWKVVERYYRIEIVGHYYYYYWLEIDFDMAVGLVVVELLAMDLKDEE